jgi:phage terminase large subunit
MTTAGLNIEIARVFEPLIKPSRYKGAWGGRGSGKSHFLKFGGCVWLNGDLLLRALRLREVQSLHTASNIGDRMS